MPSVLLAEYLNESEAKELGEKLRAVDVATIVKRHGLPRFFGVEINHKVIVDADDFTKAEPVFRQFQDDQKKIKKERTKLHTSQCPWCGSKEIFQKEKKTIWEKFRFYGVAVWRCSACGGGWYV